MKQKVLILGPSFFGYNQSIRRAFEQLGYDTRVLPYDEPIHPFTLKNMLLRKLFPSCKRLRSKSRALFNAQALAAYKAYRPDLVFIYNGDILEKETLRRFRPQSKVAIWMLDGAFLHPDSVALGTETDAYFCFEKSDVDRLRALGIPASFLPQGYDPEVYFPLSLPRDIDILFVGALYRYPERIRLLRLLVRTLGKTYKIRIYGKYKPLVKVPLQWLFREHRDIYTNRNVPPEMVNRLYNRARVCINIHHRQSREGANPKVFEICGAGAYQVVDYNPYIAGVYGEGEVGIFHSDSEFVDTVREALRQDIRPCAQQAHARVRQHHTFEHRIREALRRLDMP